MNKGLNYSERLEAYLRNELSESERTEFEDMLRQDPLLQNELTLQQDIIASICAHRKNELKQRLNNIDVKEAGRGNLGSFTMGGLVVGGIAIIGIAAFLLLNNPQENILNTQIASAIGQSAVLSDSGTQTTAAPVEEVAVATPSEVEVQTITSQNNVSEVKNLAKTSNSKVKTTKKLQIEPLVPSSEVDDELLKESEIKKENELVMPESKPFSSDTHRDDELTIVDNNTTQFKLHYKYVDGQLFLYGLDKTYHIIDLPSQTQRYVYYNGHYYKLNRNQPQIVPMPQVINEKEIQLVDNYNKEMKHK